MRPGNCSSCGAPLEINNRFKQITPKKEIEVFAGRPLLKKDTVI